MLWSALVIGFLGNFHCIGMCGPIALSLPIGRLNRKQKVACIFLYNFGRVIAYGLIGGVIGVFGLGFRYMGMVQGLSVISGVLLICIGVLSFSKWKFKRSNGIKIIGHWVQKKISYYMHRKNWLTHFFIGFFNGFLPCGLVYTALVGSLIMVSWSGSVIYMMTFGLGTLPLMLVLPYIGDWITKELRAKMRKLIPYSMLFFGVLFIIRGANLGIPYLSPKIEKAEFTQENGEDAIPILKCH